MEHAGADAHRCEKVYPALQPVNDVRLVLPRYVGAEPQVALGDGDAVFLGEFSELLPTAVGLPLSSSLAPCSVDSSRSHHPLRANVSTISSGDNSTRKLVHIPGFI